MLEDVPGWVHLLGRVLFSAIFITSGINHFVKRTDMAGYARAKGVPGAGLMVPLSGAVLVVGGLMVLLGWQPAWGALLIFLFLVPTAFLMHAFWKEEDPQAQQTEMAMFMKNVSMAGAALLILYYAGEAWPFSL